MRLSEDLSRTDPYRGLRFTQPQPKKIYASCVEVVLEDSNLTQHLIFVERKPAVSE